MSERLKRISIQGFHVADSSDIDGSVFICDGDHIVVHARVLHPKKDGVSRIRTWLALLAFHILVRLETELFYTNDNEN